MAEFIYGDSVICTSNSVTEFISNSYATILKEKLGEDYDISVLNSYLYIVHKLTGIGVAINSSSMRVTYNGNLGTNKVSWSGSGSGKYIASLLIFKTNNGLVLEIDKVSGNSPGNHSQFGECCINTTTGSVACKSMRSIQNSNSTTQFILYNNGIESIETRSCNVTPTPSNVSSKRYILSELQNTEIGSGIYHCKYGFTANGTISDGTNSYFVGLDLAIPE